MFTLRKRTLGTNESTAAAAGRSRAARAVHRRRCCRSHAGAKYAARPGARLAEWLTGRQLSGTAG